jgi:hypothetical protein
VNQLKRDKDDAQKVISKYDAMFREIRDVVDRTLTDTLVNEEDRTRLMALFSRRGELQTVDSEHDRHEDSAVMSYFIDWLISGDGKRKISKVGDTDRTRFAYEKILRERNVRVSPFFPAITSSARLRDHNHWLQQDWLRDKPVLGRAAGADGGGGASASSRDAAGRKALTDTPELYMLDINPKSAKEMEAARDLIATHAGQTVLGSAFKRTFCNVQFPGTGAVEAVINDSLKQRWKNGVNLLLRLVPDSYTITGQPLGPCIGTDSVHSFVMPFVVQMVGQSPHSINICHGLQAYIDRSGGEAPDSATPKERLIRDFFLKRTRVQSRHKFII